MISRIENDERNWILHWQTMTNDDEMWIESRMLDEWQVRRKIIDLL